MRESIQNPGQSPGRNPGTFRARGVRTLRPTTAAMRVAVVGGGFAGAAAAIRVIEATGSPVALTVIEPRAALGRGIAYSTSEPGHLMNGPASGLSLFPEAPSHFARWLEAEARSGGWRPAAGVDWEHSQPPRQQFGAYVGSRLAASAADHVARVRLRHRRDRAVGIGRLGREFVVSLERDGPLLADIVVLATGVERRGTEAGPLAGEPRYLADPYRADAFAGAAGAAEVVVLGTGLAMLDALVSLERAGFRGRITALSRRGLMVEPRRTVGAREDFFGPNVVSLHDLLRRVQEERHAMAARGEDWQGLVPAVRAAAPWLWTRLSADEQRRFLRHLQGAWRSCVHLAPVETHRLAERLRDEGRLEIVQGQLAGVTAEADGMHVALLPPEGPARSLRGDLVVNCLGHRSEAGPTGDPLVRALHDRGLARPHASGLGIDVDPASLAVVAANGRPSGRLFAIGHPMRGAVWESTSVREIADQARRLGDTIAHEAALIAEAEAEPRRPVRRVG